MIISLAEDFPSALLIQNIYCTCSTGNAMEKIASVV